MTIVSQMAALLVGWPRVQPDFRPANRPAEGLAGLSAGRKSGLIRHPPLLTY